MIRNLMPCQTYDPARGSFFVHDVPVKRGSKPKLSHGRPVYHGSNHLERRTATLHPHPESFEFTVR